MRKAKLFCAALCGVLMVTGCGSTIPEMTPEQSAVVSEYAAGLLLKYDKNYNSRVEDTTAYHQQLLKEEEERQKAEEEKRKAEEKQAAQEAEQSGKTQSKAGGEQTAPTVETMEEFFGLSDVQIKYSGYEVYDSYPQGSEEEPVFAVTATVGNKLLVCSFEVANIAAGDSQVNLLDLGAKFRVRLNGSGEKPALFTYLPDELASYQGTIAAGESVKTVVIFEISIEESESIESIAFTAKSNEGRATFNLQ